MVCEGERGNREKGIREKNKGEEKDAECVRKEEEG